MPRAVFLLGPNEWDDGVHVPAPLWAAELLGELPEPFTPKHLRLAAAARIEAESDGRVSAVVMDPKGQKPSEDDADYFERIERERAIDAYFVVVPLRTKILGTVFEGGMLRRDFAHGRRPYIAVFIERGAARIDEHERWEFVEKGHRTRYLASLAKVAGLVQEWETLEDLVESLVERATAE